MCDDLALCGLDFGMNADGVRVAGTTYCFAFKIEYVLIAFKIIFTDFME